MSNCAPNISQDNIRFLRHQRESLVNNPMPLSPYAPSTPVSGARLAARAPSPVETSQATAGDAHHDFGGPGEEGGVSGISRSDGDSGIPKPRGPGRPKCSRASVRAVGGSAAASSSRLKATAKGATGTAASSWRRCPVAMTSGAKAAAAAPTRLAGASKRGFSEIGGDVLACRKNENGVTSPAIVRADARARADPRDSNKRQRIQRRGAGDKRKVEALLLANLSQAEPAAVVSPSSRGFDAINVKGNHEDEKSRALAVVRAPWENAHHPAEWLNSPFSDGESSDGDRWVDRAGGRCVPAGGFSKSGPVSPLQAMGDLHAADSQIPHNGQAFSTTYGGGVSKTDSFYSCSETTASMSSEEEERVHSEQDGEDPLFSSLEASGTLVKSTTSTGSSGEMESVLLRGSALPRPLWSADGGVGAVATFDRASLELPFALDIPDVGTFSSGMGSNAGSSWLSTGGDASFYCNDAFTFIPSGLVGGGW